MVDFKFFQKNLIRYLTLPNFAHYGEFQIFSKKFNKIFDLTKLWSL